MRSANMMQNSSSPIPLPPVLQQRAAEARLDGARIAPGASEAVETAVATGATLFQPGDDREPLRVERGAVCQFQRWPDGRVDMIEFAFPGDVIGLGYLPGHTSSAVAMVDTVVSVMPTDTLEQRLAVDDRLALSLAAAGEREFEFLRAKSLRTALLPPLEKVANYLLAIASIEQSEGRYSVLVSDEVASGRSTPHEHRYAVDGAAELASQRHPGFIRQSFDHPRRRPARRHRWLQRLKQALVAARLFA